MIECLALTSVLWQGATALPQCSAVSLDVAGRGWMMLPQTGIPTDFALHRAGIGLGFAQGDLHGRVQIGHIQTGGTNSYIGIGGESNVYRIQLAGVQYDLLIPFSYRLASLKTCGSSPAIIRGIIGT